MLPPMTVAEQVESWTASGANVATIIGIAVAGWWAYSRFVKHRTGKPHASIEYGSWDRSLSSAKRLFRLELRIENTGTVLLPIEKLRCEIYQVLPPTAATSQLLSAGTLIDDDGEAKLTCLDERKMEWAKTEFEIEPGESDVVPFDFVIATEVESILIYAHIPNCTKGESVGWDLSTIHDCCPMDTAETGPAPTETED
jgi:hypothetical protein